MQILKSDPPAQVIDAFREVQSAKVEKEKIINLAEAYKSDVIPKAKGEALETIAKAKAVAYEIKQKALAEIDLFNYLNKHYSRSPQLAYNSIYLEGMADILANIDKIMVAKDLKNVNIFLSEDSDNARQVENLRLDTAAKVAHSK